MRLRPFIFRHDALFQLIRISVCHCCFYQKLYWCCSRNHRIPQLQRSKKSHLTGNNQADYWRQLSPEKTIWHPFYREAFQCIGHSWATAVSVSNIWASHNIWFASRTSSVISGEIWISHKTSHISRDQWATHRHLSKFANREQWHHRSIGWGKGHVRYSGHHASEFWRIIWQDDDRCY